MNRRRKPKELRWHRGAAEDLAEIVEYLFADSWEAAERFTDRLFARLELLRTTPRMGPVCPCFRKARHVVHGKYVVYYTVHRKEVVIRALVHSARQFQRAWLERDE